MKGQKSLESILEEHIRKMLKRTDMEDADQMRLLDIGVKLVLAQAKVPGEDTGKDGAFFQNGKFTQRGNHAAK